ncbi:MAG: FGGY-family carbohydrate kinase [Rhodobacteraceae bacterium]|nr:FGGY-family carbohydrate kinase [Paracoccaceae bacterium]
MDKLALGIDVGTSGVRAAVIDASGTPQGSGAAGMSEFGPDHRDPGVWAQALAAALERLGATVDLGRVGAVSVDATSGTVLALGDDDAPIGGALMYNDAVEDPEIPEAIAKVAPRESAAHGAASALARAIVLQDRPGAVRIAHQADWIASLLAGRPVGSDESNALKTGYDPVARRWPEWLSQTPLRLEVLPEVAPCGAVVMALNGGGESLSGASKDSVLVAGVTDGCASFLATGASAPGEGVTALGTTLTIKLLSDRPVFAPEYGVYSHRIGDMWLAGGASNSGGGVLAEYFAPEEIDTLSSRINPDADSGCDFYPLSRRGERFPINDPDHAPRLAPRPREDAQFLHGMLEGIGRIEALGYRRLAELGAPKLKMLRTVGGGAANMVWSALRSRIIGAEMAAAESDAAAIGVARLALPHLGAAR